LTGIQRIIVADRTRRSTADDVVLAWRDSPVVMALLNVLATKRRWSPLGRFNP